MLGWQQFSGFIAFRREYLSGTGLSFSQL